MGYHGVSVLRVSVVGPTSDIGGLPPTSDTRVVPRARSGTPTPDVVPGESVGGGTQERNGTEGRREEGTRRRSEGWSEWRESEREKERENYLPLPNTREDL